jgi:signal transduction histidine kinase
MRLRLVAAFLTIIVLMLLVQDVPLVRYLDQVEHSQIYTSLERDAWRLADSLDSEISNNKTEELQTIATEYANQSGARVVIVDELGIVLVSSDGDDVGTNYLNRPEIVDALRGFEVSGERDSQSLGQSLLYVAVPVELENVTIGALRITYPGSVIDGIIANRIRGIVIVATLTLLITLAVTLIVANAITRRLRKLQSATSEISAGNLKVRLSNKSVIGGAPELRQLEGAFDTMVERLSGVLDSQKSFASDASHQLRTPLTALRLTLENAADVVDDPNRVGEALENASTQVIRLQMLIDGLLALARLEGSTPALKPTDITQLIDQRIQMWQPLADEKNIKIVADIRAGLWVLATDSSIDQIIDAYLDNALDFAPKGSTLSLRAFATGNHVQIHVIDEGPGMSLEQLDRAFDRFWRGRADGTGTGLGLAIVARLAEVIGATVGLEQVNPDGSGLDAYVIAPKINEPK